MTAPIPGRCGECRWASRVDTRRGSRFLRCGRSDFDPAFVRYPRLPVLDCSGFEPGPTGSQPERERGDETAKS